MIAWRRDLSSRALGRDLGVISAGGGGERHLLRLVKRIVEIGPTPNADVQIELSGGKVVLWISALSSGACDVGLLWGVTRPIGSYSIPESRLEPDSPSRYSPSKKKLEARPMG